MKLIIAGSRTFNNFDEGLIDQILQFHAIFPSEVICGCGGTDASKVQDLIDKDQIVSDQGIDRLGEIWARTYSVAIDYTPAQWKLEGLPAGPNRNRFMAEKADALLLIWDGKSKGSRGMRNEMDTLNKPIYEIVIKKQLPIVI